MILKVGALTVYQNGNNSHNLPSHPISAWNERHYREEGVIIITGLMVEERLKAAGLDKR